MKVFAKAPDTSRRGDRSPEEEVRERKMRSPARWKRALPGTDVSPIRAAVQAWDAAWAWVERVV